MTGPQPITIGVLALQGAFREHLQLLALASRHLPSSAYSFSFTLVRTAAELSACSALIIPGGESTTISLIAASNNLLGPLRGFVKLDRRPVWGTCAGMILLAEKANRTKKGGQELIGGLDVRVERNAFGRQRESFVVDLDVPWVAGDDGEASPFKAVFIRAPVVEAVLHAEEREESQRNEGDEVSAPAVESKTEGGKGKVEVLAELPPQKDGEEKRIVAVRQGNVVGTSFHPELTGDWRMHRWWLMTVIEDLERRGRLGEKLEA